MKKYFFFSSILIIISFLFFNFLSPKENSEKIGDIIHQREFNSYFRSFTLTTPDSVHFVWELFPLYAPDIWERYDKEIHKNVYWQSNTLFYFKRSNKFFPIIGSILEKNNIPNDFKYLATIESGLENVVSPAGHLVFGAIYERNCKRSRNGS